MYDIGTWSYLTSTGASTHVIASDRRLLALRAFANAADGQVMLYARTTTTGLTSADTTGAIRVRNGTGFDWSPATEVHPIVVKVTSSIDCFIQVSS